MYRSAPLELPRRPAEPGLVDDVVRQFADPYAYLRELVQNALDARSPAIEVRVQRDGQGRVTTAVIDAGSGMSRATLEGPLLTLFASPKENDREAIGKYGIGFVSVLACDPVHVEVCSRAGDETWLLRLFGDHSYELESAPSRAEVGTTVTLLQTMTSAEMQVHCQKVRESLERWCRFARAPIRLHTLDLDDPAAAEEHDIVRALTLDGIASARWEDGETRIVVAVRPFGEPDFLGYYNRGLTLHETSQPPAELEGLCVLIDSPKLAHTLSRDDVRHDRAQRALLERAVTLVRSTLVRDLATALARAAEAGTEECAALVDALARKTLFLRDVVRLPLVVPLNGRRSLPLPEILSRCSGVLYFDDSTSLQAEVLSRAGTPVVRGRALRAPLQRCELEPSTTILGPWLEVALGLTPSAAEQRMLEAALPLIALGSRHPLRHLFLARFSKSGVGAFRRAATSVSYAVFDRESGNEVARSLFIDVSHPNVQAVCRLATRDVREAACFLARLALLDEGPLSAAAVDGLLVEAARP